MNPDGAARTQPEFGSFVDADDVTAGPQGVEDARAADPREVFRWARAPEDRQPPQLVGLVVGRRVRQHVRLRVLDAHHAVGAVGDRLGEPEQVGAGVLQRVGAVAVVLEDVVDESVEALPPGPGFDGHHRRARGDGAGHHRVGGFLDEDRSRRQSRRLLVEPSQHVVLVDSQQEEHVRRSCARREAQSYVVGIDQRGRRDG